MILKDITNREIKKYQLEKIMFIGSSMDCDVVLNSKTVGFRHASIENNNGEILVKDLDTKCGTYINGVRILKSYMKHGDILRVADEEFILEEKNMEMELKSDFLKSKNKKWSDTLIELPHYSKSELPVLILGPSGSGKEYISEFLHKSSFRRNGPLIKVNCSALTETLVESELFGHKRGSFTGAFGDRKGAFEAARNGTLILDEIGDLPLELQPKLLRALENKEIKPVGSDTTIKTNVRIIASTHQDLKQKVMQGTFRRDLYYRLNVIKIQVPSLSDRLEDFELILFNLARDMRLKLNLDAITELKKHNWPGNIRELKNIMSRLSVCYQAPHIIDGNQIKDLLENSSLDDDGFIVGDKKRNANLIKEVEKQMIIKRLIANSGNQRKVANELGIPKSTLNDRIKNYGICIEELLTHKGLKSSG